MCANRPITDEERRAVYTTPPEALAAAFAEGAVDAVPANPPLSLAPIETAVPPGWEATTEHTEHTEDALAALADEMHAKCEELFGGARLGQWAAAMLIDSYADRIERALGIQPRPKTDRRTDGQTDRPTDGQTDRPTDGGNALGHCGYRVEHDELSGHFAFSLETPYEGATIQAGMAPAGGTYRRWDCCVRVLNCRGQGWTVRSEFHDCGRWVAKKLLVTLALEMRKAYTHRGQKIRKRAIARAIARRQAEEGAR